MSKITFSIFLILVMAFHFVDFKNIFPKGEQFISKISTMTKMKYEALQQQKTKQAIKQEEAQIFIVKNEFIASPKEAAELVRKESVEMSREELVNQISLILKREVNGR